MRKINREKFKKKCYVLLRVIVTLYLVIKRNHTIVPEKSRFSVWFSVFSTETETETD